MHLLAYHALDVAAVGHVYLQRSPALLAVSCLPIMRSAQTARPAVACSSPTPKTASSAQKMACAGIFCAPWWI